MHGFEHSFVLLHSFLEQPDGVIGRRTRPIVAETK